jgi:hypothetical protein
LEAFYVFDRQAVTAVGDGAIAAITAKGLLQEEE